MIRRAEQIIREAISRFFVQVKSKQAVEKQQLSAVKISSTVPKKLQQDHPVTQQELDAFKMKAIVLLKESGIPLSLARAPFIPEAKLVREEERTVLHLTHVIEESGKKFQVEGSFVRTAKLAKFSKPENFFLKEITGIEARSQEVFSCTGLEDLQKSSPLDPSPQLSPGT